MQTAMPPIERIAAKEAIHSGIVPHREGDTVAGADLVAVHQRIRDLVDLRHQGGEAQRLVLVDEEGLVAMQAREGKGFAHGFLELVEDLQRAAFDAALDDLEGRAGAGEHRHRLIPTHRLRHADRLLGVRPSNGSGRGTARPPGSPPSITERRRSSSISEPRSPATSGPRGRLESHRRMVDARGPRASRGGIPP